MDILFHLAGTFIAIIIYTLAYAAITFFILYVASVSIKIDFLKRIRYSKGSTFKRICIIYGVLFSIYSFSHFGDNGIGDSFQIPIGNNYYVQNIDGAETYFEDEQKDGSRQASITNFSVKDFKLCAAFQGFNSKDCQDCFIVFDVKQAKMFEFHSSKEYLQFAKANKLPNPTEFKDFLTNYEQYWSKKRHWFLP